MRESGSPQGDSKSWKPKTEEEESGFLVRWFNRNQESVLSTPEREASQEDEDEDEESESTLPKRFRRFFRRLFPRMVEPAEQGTDNFPRLFALAGAVERDIAPTPEQPVAEAPDSEYVWHRTDTDRQNVVTDTPSVSSREVAAPVTPIESYQRPLFERPTTVDTVEPLPRESTERSAATVPEVATKTVVERREVQRDSGATMALLGAEFFARRRADRKLDRKLTGEIQSLEKQVHTGKESQVRLEQVTAKRTPEVATPVPVSAERIQVVPRPEKQQPAPEQKRTQFEQPKASIERSAVNKELSPNRARLTEKHVQPEVLLEKVAEAAEHNAPIERAYERRQEIKDEAGMPMSAGGASAVGEILLQTAAAPATVTVNYEQPAPKQPALRAPAKNQQLYQNAVTTGVGGALVIIIFALIAYFLTK